MTKTDGGLRAIERKYLPELNWQAIETGFIAQGVPDMNYCFNGAEGWVENKVAHGWVVSTLKPAQVGWALRRTRAGGRVFFAIRRAPKGDDELWVVPGKMARELIDFGLRKIPPRYRFGAGGPGKWGWEEVKTLLTS